MNTAPDTEPDAGLVRFLKLLVSALAITMIVGLIVLIGLFVKRFPQPTTAPASIALPATIALPEGTRASAFTQGPGWLAVVTSDGRILIYSPDGQTLRQEIRVGAVE